MASKAVDVWRQENAGKFVTKISPQSGRQKSSPIPPTSRYATGQEKYALESPQKIRKPLIPRFLIARSL
jgi:hypothetical protein